MLTYGLEQINGATVVHLGRHLDRLEAPMAAQALMEAVARGRDVVADLSATAYLDGGGIAVLSAARDACQGRGRRFVVVAPPGAFLRRTLEGLRLIPPLVVVDHCEDAARLLGPPDTAT